MKRKAENRAFRKHKINPAKRSLKKNCFGEHEAAAEHVILGRN